MQIEEQPKNSKPSTIRRLTTFASTVSGIFCFAFLLLLPISYFTPLFKDVNNREIKANSLLTTSFFQMASSNGEIWLFNGDFPHQGSIITLTGTWDSVPTIEKRDWGWCNRFSCFEQVVHIDSQGNIVGKVRYGDFSGIYHRYFYWSSNNSVWWTLAISIWYPVVLTSLLPCYWLVTKFGLSLRLKIRTLLFITTIVSISLGFCKFLTSN